MEYTRLGNTGLKVSRQSVELGVMFWDTANVYQLGTSEDIVGRAITRHSCGEDIVLATKVRGKMHDGRGGEGLSRKAILEQVDVHQIHRLDPDTTVGERWETLHANWTCLAVRRGRGWVR